MNITSIDLNLLRAFDVLMKERSVTRAAKVLNLTQPAMSNVLRRLREALDDPVLVRTGQGMQPTPKAMSIACEVRAGLTLITKSLSATSRFEPAESAMTFHLATTDYMQLVLLPRLLKHLKTIAPGLKLEIHELGLDIPIRAFENGEIDFALGRFPKLPSSLDSLLWRSEKLVCLVRKNHPQFLNKISLKDFLQCDQIWVNGGQRSGMVDAWLKENGLGRNVVLTTPNFLIAPIVVSQTDMLVVTPIEVARQCARRLPLQILELPMKLKNFDQHLVWHPAHASTPAHEWFKEQMQLIF